MPLKNSWKSWLEKLLRIWFCAWALGIGFKFAVRYMDGIVIYQINGFDFIFDWMILYMLAVINLVILFREGK